MFDPNDRVGPLPYNFSDSFYLSSPDSSFSEEDSFTDLTTEIKNNLSKYDGFLKIGLSNVQSLVPHFSEFVSYVLAGNFDIVAITETWLKSIISDKSITIPGYHLVRNDRSKKGGGGVAAYIKVGLNTKVVFASASDGHEIEQLWLQLRIKNKSIVLGVIYRPPALPLSCFQSVEQSLFNFASDCDDVILIGDFNINLLKPSVPGGKIVNNLCTVHDLKQLVTSPTYICSNANSLLDLVMVRESANVKYIEQTIQPGISHHNFVYFAYDITVSRSNNKYITTRNWKKIDTNAFHHALSVAPWHHIIIKLILMIKSRPLTV